MSCENNAKNDGKLALGTIVHKNEVTLEANLSDELI